MNGETLYTCPMHPEIERSNPGSCPLCGMAGIPITAGILYPFRGDCKSLSSVSIIVNALPFEKSV